MTNRSITRFRRNGVRRARQWGIINANGSLIAATHAAQIAFELNAELDSDLASNMHNVTASAMNINVTYRQTAGMRGDDDTIWCGVAWVSQRAFDAGGVALPDPSTDHYDWMFNDGRTLVNELAADGDVMARNGFLEVRNNSMRKQRENSSVLVMIFRSILLQSTSVQVFVSGRTLFLFP